MKPEEVSKLALGLPVQGRAKLALDLLASLENVRGFDIGKLLAMDPFEIEGFVFQGGLTVLDRVFGASEAAPGLPNIGDLTPAKIP